MAALEPYHFEPEHVDAETQPSDDKNEGSERLLNLSCCIYGCCEIRETGRECICCLQEPESKNKFTEGILRRLVLLRIEPYKNVMFLAVFRHEF